MSTMWRALLCVRWRGRETRAGLSFRTPARAPRRPRRGVSPKSPAARWPPPTRSACDTSALACRSGR
eukprot:13414146-Alexandrium_andersonii.AAC.1